MKTTEGLAFISYTVLSLILVMRYDNACRGPLERTHWHERSNVPVTVDNSCRGAIHSSQGTCFYQYHLVHFS